MKKKNVLIALLVILVLLIGWAGFTKAGFIPNFTESDFLCPGSKQIKKQATNDQTTTRTQEEIEEYNEILVGKPVIYLYPERPTDINIELNFDGKIIADYPTYNKNIKGWNVTASPDGTLINKEDNKQYSYIFWEGIPTQPINWDLSKGFVVKGEETKFFLQGILPKLGLTPREYNEFIVYWYPLMKDNNYNLIHFAKEQYTDLAPLSITPQPDSVLRVFMVYKALDEKIEVEEQEIIPFQRKGFSVIEWGGTKVN